MTRTLISLCGAVFVSSATIDNGAARTPPLGYTSGCSSEVACTALAASLPASSLPAAGYTTFIVENPCFNGRSSNGTLLNPVAWPAGFASFAAALHKQGLAFGIATGQGLFTCSNCTGSAGFEAIDMALFAALGADFVEVDHCHRPIYPAHWAVFRDALNATKRSIVFEMLADGANGTVQAGPATANVWRTTNDIIPSWNGVLANLDATLTIPNISSLAAPGGFNDGGKLLVGNAGLSMLESQSHFALWVASKFPLLLATADANALTLNQSYLNLLSHPELLAVSQDASGAPAATIYDYASWYAGGAWDPAFAAGSSLFLANMSSCGGGVSDPSQQAWTFGGTSSSAGTLQPASASGMCLVPSGCGATVGTAVITAACELYPANCTLWIYDTYTTFTFTNNAALLILQDNGAGAAATLATFQGLPGQQFQYQPDSPQIVSAASGLCLGAAPPLQTFYGPLSSGATLVLLLNRGAQPLSSVTIEFSSVGLPAGATAAVRNVWARAPLGKATGSFTLPAPLPPRGTGVYTLLPVAVSMPLA